MGAGAGRGSQRRLRVPGPPGARKNPHLRIDGQPRIDPPTSTPWGSSPQVPLVSRARPQEAPAGPEVGPGYIRTSAQGWPSARPPTRCNRDHRARPPWPRRETNRAVGATDCHRPTCRSCQEGDIVREPRVDEQVKVPRAGAAPQMVQEAVTTVSRPSSLARYIAVSAAWTTSSRLSP